MEAVVLASTTYLDWCPETDWPIDLAFVVPKTRFTYIAWFQMIISEADRTNEQTKSTPRYVNFN